MYWISALKNFSEMVNEIRSLFKEDELKDGYISNENHDLCMRCFIIKNYGQNRNITKNNIDYMKIIFLTINIGFFY